MPLTRFSLLTLCFICFVSCFLRAQASVIDDLYQAKIAVEDQSEQTQNQAFSVALKQVLLKVRGKSDLLANRDINKMIRRATPFVRSYRYDIEAAQLYLVISFDQTRVDRAIRDAGFPIWDKRRPDTLVWLAIQPSEQAAKSIARVAEYSELYQQLTQTAKARGIRLIFPLWDINDLQNIDLYDIWGGFSQQIKQASERYDVPSIVSLRIYPSVMELSADQQSVAERATDAPPWTADWTLFESARILSGQLQEHSLLELAVTMVDTLADELAEKYAINIEENNQSKQQVQVVINNLNSLTLYQQALSMLNNLSVVTHATLVKQQGATATFELTLLGDVANLNNALSLDNKLKPVVDDFGQPIGELQFFWVK